MSARSRDVPVVVVGGYEYTQDMNQPATMMVRELARRRRVLYLNQEAHGALLRRAQGRGGHLGPREIARTAFGPTRPRRVEERLWLAPVRGLAAIGPLDVPEAMRRRNVRLFARVIRDWLADIGAPDCTLLFYWWAVPELVDIVPRVASAYDCSDDHSSMPGAVRRASVVKRLEDQLLDSVDHAYVVSPGLLDARAARGRNVTVLPTPFDLALFERLQREGFAVPPVLRSVRHPVIGYAGGITSRMDWDLLIQLAGRRRDWTFAFIGDPRGAPPELVEQSNVLFTGWMPYPQALAAISTFDVGMIPVRVTDFSRGNSFLKLMDYFAYGTPTVATPVPDTTVAISAAGDEAIYLASDTNGWEEAISRALAEPTDSPVREVRRALVAERSAARRAERILAEALAG
jgi:glycosyltransferase involved in cell wall biosynthesis